MAHSVDAFKMPFGGSKVKAHVDFDLRRYVGARLGLNRDAAFEIYAMRQPEEAAMVWRDFRLLYVYKTLVIRLLAGGLSTISMKSLW